MTLKSILTDLYCQAMQARGETKSVSLQHGLTITMTVKDQLELKLIRFWAKWPSEIEFRTVLESMPYQVAYRVPYQAVEGHKRILRATFPIQEVIL